MPTFTTANAGTAFTDSTVVTGVYDAFYSAGSTVKVNGVSVSGVTLSVTPPEGGSSVTLQASGTYDAAVVGNPTLKHVPRIFTEPSDSQTSQGFSSVNPLTRLVYQYIAPTPVTAVFEYAFGTVGNITATETVSQTIIPNYSASAAALNSYI